jgi:hypothetical protein
MRRARRFQFEEVLSQSLELSRTSRPLEKVRLGSKRQAPAHFLTDTCLCTKTAPTSQDVTTAIEASTDSVYTHVRVIT